MVSHCRYVVYYNRQRQQLARCDPEWWLYFSSGKEKCWVPRTGVAFQTKCNNGPTSGKIAFCQKKGNSGLGNVLQPPLTHRLYHFTAVLLWGQYGVHSRIIINSYDPTTVLCRLLSRSILVIQLLIHSKGWFSILLFLSQTGLLQLIGLCNWWQTYVTGKAASQWE